LLSISEICVLGSKSEGFSNAILEYMAAARPVVATDVGGAREAVTDGKTGYLVPAGDHQKMAACIISLLAQPELARSMGQQGHQDARKRFSSESRLQKTETLYEQLICSASRAINRLDFKQ
jgi:glycosyltransferase involved in cell wall biosynthesis